MDKARKTAEFYAVQCGECNEWIPLRPVSRIDGDITPQQFPENFNIVEGHAHQDYIFHRAEVLIRTLPEVLIKDLATIKVDTN